MYAEIINHLLFTYAMDDVTPDTATNILWFTQGPSIPVTVYVNALRMKVLRCRQVCEEAQLKGLSIEGLQSFIRRSMRAY